MARGKRSLRKTSCNKNILCADRRALKKFAMLDAVNNKQQTRLANSDGVNGEFLLNTQLVNMHYKMPLVGPIESWREADK